MSIPDIKNDKRILDSISLKFNSYNQFEEMMNIEIMSKRVEFIGTMKDSLTIQNGEDEVPYFDPEFLIIKYLHMSQADLELNEKYKKKNRLKKGDEDEEGEGEGGDEDEELGGGEDEGGSSETESSDDIDSEMLGDVEPESSETSQV